MACRRTSTAWRIGRAAVAKRVDALVTKHAPGVQRAMRWHCPFYGVEGQGWILAFAAFQRHVKFTFFKGARLKPAPPVGNVWHVRSLDVRDGDKLDEKLVASWIKQAAAIPGWGAGPKTRRRIPGLGGDGGIDIAHSISY